jgi:hypothetical protein
VRVSLDEGQKGLVGILARNGESKEPMPTTVCLIVEDSIGSAGELWALNSVMTK